MAKKRSRLSLKEWFLCIFRQPSVGFYGQPCVYWSGQTLEIEHFRRIRSYDDEKLCLEFGKKLLTVYGDHLKIETLAAHRITLKGDVLRTDFSDQ